MKDIKLETMPLNKIRAGQMYMDTEKRGLYIAIVHRDGVREELQLYNGNDASLLLCGSQRNFKDSSYDVIRIADKHTTNKLMKKLYKGFCAIQVEA